MVPGLPRHARGALLSAVVFVLCSCGGGGGGGGSASSGSLPAAPVPTPVPTATTPPVSSSAVSVSPSGPATAVLPPAAGGVSGSVLLTAASTAATITLTLSATPPSSTPSLQSNRRLVETIGAPATGLAYFTAQSSTDVSFNSAFGANISVPGPVNGAEYLVMFDPGNAGAGWVLVSGPGTAANGIARGTGSVLLTMVKGATYDFALIATQSSLTLPLPSPTPSAPPGTSTPTPAPTSAPTSTPASTPAPTPDPTPTPAPTAPPTPSPMQTPTPTPTAWPNPTPTPRPTPTPAPGPVIVNVPSLQFLSTGATFATTITVTQANYSGQFVLSGTSCNGITSTDTTISPRNFTITPLASGVCSYTLTGGGGMQTTLAVTVTVITLGGS